MNIKEAKQEIKNAILTYFSRNIDGDYELDINKQRPILMMGPPGIGKTAILQQIAQELDVGLVSYSMTHHTRQSALGLPFIDKRIYNNKEYSMTEYTMSEIIASVYEFIKKTEKFEGILFLDEINCVSETLTPAMLQFLQYKTFGQHRVPDGWLIVAAGNPPEFSDSAREFDIVTWDRVRRIDVEPDFLVWKEFAYSIEVHPVILAYLELKLDCFYKIERTIDGLSFVTARGWVDLSDTMRLYEKHKLPITRGLIEQFMSNKIIARDFSLYYNLFNKYKDNYKIDSILTGNISKSIIEKANKAKIDERYMLLSLILYLLSKEFKEIYLNEKYLLESLKFFKILKDFVHVPGASLLKSLSENKNKLEKKYSDSKSGVGLPGNQKQILLRQINIINSIIIELNKAETTDEEERFDIIQAVYKKSTDNHQASIENADKYLSNVFKFVELSFHDGQELLILISELTMNQYSSFYIKKYGSTDYFKHNKELMFYERQINLIKEIDKLG